MNAVEKNRLSQEAQMQIKALRKIRIWKITAIAISTLGIAITYAGIAGTDRNVFLGILGVVIVILGLGSAIVFNLGLKNGKRNVEKILNILEKGNMP